MSRMKNYRIDIVKRTTEILKDHFPTLEDKDREATFLMNCLLGIVVAISENKKISQSIFNESTDDDFLSMIPEKFGFITSYDNVKELRDIRLLKRTVNIGHKNELKSKSKIWFINRVRHSIAHQNIKAINEDEKWVGVILYNKPKEVIDFEIEFDIVELKIFALKLGKMYLDGLKKKST